jgi:four helix bundle protein
MKYPTELRNENRGYIKFIVWQRAMDLIMLAGQLGYKEGSIDLKLRSQLADAGQSISANFSERYSRRSINERIQFLYYALGSIERAMTLKEVNQVFAPRFDHFNALADEVENRLLRLAEKLEQKRGAGDWSARIAEEGADDPDFALTMEHSISPTPHYSTTASLRAHA